MDAVQAVRPAMDALKKIPTSLPGVFILEPRVFGDERGFFFESYNQRIMAEVGIVERFVQDNHSCSSRNVLRGLHYQVKHPQGKLVRVVEGEILDVAVDMRRSSPTLAAGKRCDCRARTSACCGFPRVLRTDSACFRKRLTCFTRRLISTHRNMNARSPGTILN